VANIINIPFYVVDEGEETEQAYWENSIPSEFSEAIEVVAEGEIINE
jgi:cytochrome c-type biogenesis protein CcmE